ncbi:MAG: MotA/TolQ/ExbB proton channel family protein [Candidatus Omnitrophota bacterium]|nr:MotA/TolQ/ExbB proton channel family protein [Candidatus Omnitrophota bacterium]
MLNLFLKGGPVMWPIAAGSVIGFTIVLVKLWAFRQMRINVFEFVQDIFKELKANKTDKALELSNKYKHNPLAAVFKIGIERRGLPSARLEKILEQAGNNQIQKLEKFTGALVSIIGIEPLLGFLGTITGLIRAFMSWENAGANITVNALAGGIYEAMITTAAGLIVAIPLYLCHNYFISRIKFIANDLTNHCIQLLEVIAEMKEPPSK